jgi:hypothetical protein
MEHQEANGADRGVSGRIRENIHKENSGFIDVCIGIVKEEGLK